MTKIDIFGSCVVRDVFRFATTENYQICTTEGRQSIPSLFSQPIKIDESLLDWSNIIKYEKKLFLLNLNQLAVDLLKNSSGEWLVLDLAEDRYGICEIQGEKGLSRICNSITMQKIKQTLFDNGVLHKNNYKEIEFDKIPWEIVEDNYKKFTRIISQKYGQEKIIIVEVKEALFLLKNNLEIVPFQSDVGQRTNQYLDKVYKLIRQLLPKANFISMPQNTLMSENHLWGIMPLHFQESYYRYVMEAIDNITKNRMTYSLLQLLNKQNSENLYLIRTLEKKSNEDVHETQKLYANVKEYEKQMFELQKKIKEINYNFAKLVTEIRHPNGSVSNSIVKLLPDKCTGCSACYNSCPVHAISMNINEEGFLYPKVDGEKCSNCGYCASVCPQLNFKIDNEKKKVCLAVKMNDEYSNSIFSVLADYVLKKEGYVCGAIWNNKFEVKHVITNRREELFQFYGPKYIQSNISDMYRKIEELLTEEKYVLFSGTPCQVDGLYHFLGVRYSTLLTVDILCRGIPSSKTFKNYLLSEAKEGEISNISFRDYGVNGWGTNTEIKYTDGSEEQMSIQNCLWTNGYLRSYFNRNVCYNCPYSQSKRVGDFTTGNYWGITQTRPDLPSDAKVLTLNSDKAKKVFNEISDKFTLKEWMPIESATKYNNGWTHSTAKPTQRDVFFYHIKEKSFIEAFEETVYGGKIFDIGIVGWWYYYNYGSILTYYALNRALVRMGYSVLMIHHTNNGSKPSRLANAFPENFIKKYCSISHFYSDNDVHLLNKRCRAFISGSDQLWNPKCERDAGKEFFLDFVDDNHLKLSYASSLGNTVDASKDFKEKYAPLAQRFAGVSVREEAGILGCKNIYGVDAVRVCDPVFLCETVEFEELARKSKENLIGKKFLLSFILDPDENKKRIIREKADEMNVEIINLVDLTGAGEKAQQMGIEETKPFAPVEDFLNYFFNASFVITDSFHGTCFSIICNKEFISLANYGRGEKRVAELLRWLRLDDRMLYQMDKSVADIQMKTIDYSNVNEIIAKARYEAKSWLETYLQQIKRKE